MALKRKASEIDPPNSPRPKEFLPQPYRYEVLLFNQIGVLVLAPGMLDEPLRGTLEIVSLDELDEGSKYKAISYAWGNQIFPHMLYLTQCQLNITESLFSALRRFRSESESVRLWADAICINQGLVEEKNHQVTRMADIFERASEVLVWLGQADDSDCLVSAVCSNIAVHIEEHGDPYTWEGETHMKLFGSVEGHMTSSVSFQCGEALESLPHKVANAFRSFWQRPWFARLWVIQEAAVAASLTYFYGQHIVNRDTLLDVVMAWRFFTSNPAGDLFTTRINLDQTLRVERFLVIIHEWQRFARHGYHNLLGTIVHAAGCITSKSQDRVFAIRRLALVDNVDALIPNYALPLEAIWTRVAIVELTTPSSWRYNDIVPYSPILVLALVGTQQSPPSGAQPSWVPDFGNLTTESVEKHVFHEVESRNMWAGGRCKLEVCVNEPAGLLQLAGRFLSRIVRMRADSQYQRVPIMSDKLCVAAERYPGNSVGFRKEIKAKIFSWYVNCRSFISSYAKEYELQDGVLKELFEHGTRVDVPECSDYEEFEGAFEQWKNSIQAKQAAEIDQLQMYNVLKSLLSRNPVDVSFIGATEMLATTADGHIGWIPEATQPGDFVTLFQGSPFPFILRERGDGNYTVIGDAYVQGIMHGEEWPEDGEGVHLIGMK